LLGGQDIRSVALSFCADDLAQLFSFAGSAIGWLKRAAQSLPLPGARLPTLAAMVFLLLWLSGPDVLAQELVGAPHL
jgi:hypothetical protein